MATKGTKKVRVQKEAKAPAETFDIVVGMGPSAHVAFTLLDETEATALVALANKCAHLHPESASVRKRAL